MTIINDKYKGKYKGASDWIGKFIEQNASDTVETGEGDSKKTSTAYNVDKMLQLATNNGMDVSKLNGAGVGRVRMTVGNSLRARAKKRHGLYDLSNKWAEAPAEFLEESGAPENPTETHDGDKIKAAKEAA